MAGDPPPTDRSPWSLDLSDGVKKGIVALALAGAAYLVDLRIATHSVVQEAVRDRKAIRSLLRDEIREAREERSEITSELTRQLSAQEGRLAAMEALLRRVHEILDRGGTGGGGR